MEKENVVLSYLIRQELGWKPSVYFNRIAFPGVPSSYTIGCGIDLGQQSIAALERYGVRNELIQKIKPMIGNKKPKDAIDFTTYDLNTALKRGWTNGLLTSDEIVELTLLVVKGYLNQFKGLFFDITKIDFNTLALATKCLLTAMNYNEGPSFWGKTLSTSKTTIDNTFKQLLVAYIMSQQENEIPKLIQQVIDCWKTGSYSNRILSNGELIRVGNDALGPVIQGNINGQVLFARWIRNFSKEEGKNRVTILKDILLPLYNGEDPSIINKDDPVSKILLERF